MKNFDKIATYLNGQMSEIDKQSFEKEMVNNKGLAEEVATQRFEKKTLQLASKNDLKNRIQKMRESSPLIIEKEKNSVGLLKRLWLPLAVAASFLLLIGYFFQPKNYTNEQLIATHYQFDASEMVRKGTTTSSTLTVANRLFEAKKYQEVIQNLEPITQIDSLAVQANYLIGHSYFNQLNYEAASRYFNQVQKEKSTAANLRRDAQWYWVLSKLGMNQVDDSLNKQLDILIDEEYVGAKELKEKLNL